MWLVPFLLAVGAVAVVGAPMLFCFLVPNRADNGAIRVFTAVGFMTLFYGIAVVVQSSERLGFGTLAIPGFMAVFSLTLCTGAFACFSFAVHSKFRPPKSTLYFGISIASGAVAIFSAIRFFPALLHLLTGKL